MQRVRLTHNEGHFQMNKGNQNPPPYCIPQVCHRKLGNANTPGIVTWI